MGLDPMELSCGRSFLFNYNEDADPSSVLKYFQDEGISAKHARYRCHPDSQVKHFVMKFRDRDDFDKIVLALPDFTGCRWYDPVNRPDREKRPKGFFNNGQRITGPGLSIQAYGHGTPSRSVQISPSAFNTPVPETVPSEVSSGVRSSPPPYTRFSADVQVPQTSIPVTTNQVSTTPQASVTTTDSISATAKTTTTVTFSAPSLVLSVSKFITPLPPIETGDSPKFQVGSPMSLNYVPDKK